MANHLVFLLGGEERFALDSLYVNGIFHKPEMTTPPSLPLGMEGIYSLRGNVVPVFNISGYLGHPVNNEKLGVLLFLNTPVSGDIGLLVSEIDVVMDLTPINHVASEIVTSVAITENNRLVSIVNLPRLLDQISKRIL